MFTMPEKEFLRFWEQSAHKACCILNDNGIGTFATEHIHGLVRFGGSRQPGMVNAEFTSATGRVCQHITVKSSSCENSLERLLVVLANYRFTEDRGLERDELETCIRNALKADSRLVEEQPKGE